MKIPVAVTAIASLLSIVLLCAPSAAQKKRPYPMTYGPHMAGTWKALWPRDNYALKGLSIRVDGAATPAQVIFDTELLRVSAVALDHRQELRGTAYDGAHGPGPKLVGHEVLATPVAPGWAFAGSFNDPRAIPYGPLPRTWGRYKGLYLYGREAVVRYDVGGCDVLEHFAVRGEGDDRLLLRTLDLGKSARPMTMMVGMRQDGPPELGADGVVVFRHEVAEKEAGPGRAGPYVTGVALSGAPTGAKLAVIDGTVRLLLPPRRARQQLDLVIFDCRADSLAAVKKQVAGLTPPAALASMTKGGPGRWPHIIETKGKLGTGKGAYAVDRLGIPSDSEAASRLRYGAFDFFSDGRAALSTWNGDVWIVSGIDAELKHLKWKRFATGLFDPLGLKIVNDVIYTLGRDGITRLHDLDGDGEADFYECFNNDVLITKSFHEFAFDLQTDPQGNFYFSKAGPVRPGGRGFDKIVPHHGCVLKVSKDGAKLEVFATGLRAPNGIGVGPHGEVTSGDNEGTWVPACRLNWMKQGTFNGCMDTAHMDPKPKMYDYPICFLPMSIDNSGGGQVWVTTDKWGPFEGDLLHLSYGKSTLFKTMREEVDGVTQGGVTPFPLKFTSSCMRARVHPQTGQLFVCGFRGWQTNAVAMTGFDRVRYTGKPVRMLTGLKTSRYGVFLTFTCKLDKATAEDPESYEVEAWNYLWTHKYGSPEVKTVGADPNANKGAKPEHDVWRVERAALQADGKTVFLALPDIKPVMQMRVKFDVDSADGETIKSALHCSIHRLPKSK